MLKRIISGVVAAIILIAVLFMHTYVIRIALSGVLLLCMFEALRCFGLEKKKPLAFIGIFASVIMPFMDIIGMQFFAPLFFIILALLCFSTIFGYKNISVQDISSMSFITLLIPFALSHLMYIRSLEMGAYYIWLPLLGAFGADTGAYFIGCAIRGKKLCEALSPKKTVAGSVGAFIGSVVAFAIYLVILKFIAGIQVRYIPYFVISIICGGLSQIGDLTASSLKRANNIKDFGKIMPGHGGMLDRVDSLSLIAPFVYYVLTVVSQNIFYLN